MPEKVSTVVAASSSKKSPPLLPTQNNAVDELKRALGTAAAVDVDSPATTRFIEELRSKVDATFLHSDKGRILFEQQKEILTNYALHFKARKKVMDAVGPGDAEERNERQWKYRTAIAAIDRFQRQLAIGDKTPQWGLSLFQCYDSMHGLVYGDTLDNLGFGESLSGMGAR